jgi:hypothetical protein
VPPGSFDLVALSELLYYFDHAGLGLGLGSLRPAGRSSRCTGGIPRPATPALVARRGAAAASATISPDWTPKQARPPPEGTAAASDVCRPTSG